MRATRSLQAESWYPISNTAMHRVTSLALKRKKRTALATETTCGHCWQSYKEGLSWQGKPGNETETLQKLRFFQNNFPKANLQKVT